MPAKPTTPPTRVVLPAQRVTSRRPRGPFASLAPQDRPLARTISHVLRVGPASTQAREPRVRTARQAKRTIVATPAVKSATLVLRTGVQVVLVPRVPLGPSTMCESLTQQRNSLRRER